MSKKVILIFWINLIVGEIWAQIPDRGIYEYKLSVKIKNTNNGGKKCDNYMIWYVIRDGFTKEEEAYNQNLKPIGDSWKEYSYTYTTNASQKINKVKFYAKRSWKNAFSCKNRKGESDLFSIPSSFYPCGSMTFEDEIPVYTSSVLLEVKPKTIRIYYFDYNNSYQSMVDRQILTDKKKISLKATTDFPPSTYAWQYRIGESKGWKALPSSLYSGAIASFTGEDLLGAERFREVLKQKKYIYIKIAGCTESPIMQLIPQLYGPKIVKVEAFSPSCSFSNDGKIKVHFDRSLLEGEKVDISLNYGQQVRLQNQEQEAELTGLSPIGYTVQIVQGAYPDDKPSYVSDYTDHGYKYVVVPVPTDPVLKTIFTAEVKCYGGEDGKISFQASGGRGKLYLLYSAKDSVLVSRDVTTEIGGLIAGSYQIRLHGENGCTARENNQEKVWNVQVTQPAAGVFVQQLNTPVNPSGYKLKNGKIELVTTGGAPGYVYEWRKNNVVMPGVVGNQSNTLGEGEYHIYVRDAHYNSVVPATAKNRAGCWNEVKIKLTQPDSLYGLVSVNTPVSCYGKNDAVLEVKGFGGVKPYLYQWQLMQGSQWQDLSGETGIELEQIYAGTYRVRITDKNGNQTLSEPYILTQPTPLKVEFQAKMPDCYGMTNGQLTAIGIGGTPDYTYQWIGRPEQVATLVVGKGEYRVRVKDKNGCQLDSSFLLGEPSLLTASCSITLPSGHDAWDGKVEIQASGGTPYADGSYRYQWDYRGDTLNPLVGIPADSVAYHAVVRDAHQCVTEVYPRVIYPLGVEITVRDSISCSGVPDGRLEALAVGGVSRNYRYEWYKLKLNGTLTPAGTAKISSALFAGHYRVKVTDTEGNTDSASVVFREPEPLELKLQPRHLLCKYDTDGILKAVVTGGTIPYQYSWSTGESTRQIEGLEEGRYQVGVRDKRGCFIEDTLSIQSPDEVLPLLSFIPPRAYQYSDASVWVTTTGGVLPYTYIWTDREEVTDRIDSIPAGVYEVEVTDDNGCRKVLSTEIPDPPLLEAFISQTRVISCRDSSDAQLVAAAKGGVGTVYKYQWYRVVDGRGTEGMKGAVADSLPAGVYRVKVTDENRIDAWSADFEITQPDYLTVQAAANTIPCNGGTEGWVDAQVAGGTQPYRYFWTSGDTISRVEGLTDGSYLVLVEDAHNCRAEALTEITVPGGLVVTARLENPMCNGDENGSVELQVEGGVKPYRIEWGNGTEGEKCFRLAAGTYPVVVTDANGCFRKTEYVLTDPPEITADIGPDRTLCRDQWCELKRTGEVEAVVYRWFRDGQFLASGPVVKAEDAGVYRVEVEDEAGCMAGDETVITRNEAVIDANFAVAAQVEAGEVVKLVNTSYPEPDTVEWLLPEGPEVTVLASDSVLTEVILNQEGTYLFGIRSVVGFCEAVLYKQVYAGTATENLPLTRVKEPMIREVLLWPNPNDGHFRVRVHLREAGKGVIRMYSIAGILVGERKYEGSDLYELEYQEALSAGVYILQVVCGRERETLRWIVE